MVSCSAGLALNSSSLCSSHWWKTWVLWRESSEMPGHSSIYTCNPSTKDSEVGRLRISVQLGLYSRPCSKSPYPYKQTKTTEKAQGWYIFPIFILYHHKAIMPAKGNLHSQKCICKTPSFSTINAQLVSDTFQLSLLHSRIDWQNSGLKNRNKVWLLAGCVGRRCSLASEGICIVCIWLKKREELEMAQWLYCIRVLDALPKYQSLYPSTHATWPTTA